jgi:hypothetical protein
MEHPLEIFPPDIRTLAAPFIFSSHFSFIPFSLSSLSFVLPVLTPRSVSVHAFPTLLPPPRSSRAASTPASALDASTSRAVSALSLHLPLPAHFSLRPPPCLVLRIRMENSEEKLSGASFFVSALLKGPN